MELLINTLLAPLVGAFTGWFFARRKQKAEARQSELDAVEKAVSIWREVAEGLKKELQEQRAKITDLSAQVEKLHTDNARLLAELKKVKKLNPES